MAAHLVERLDCAIALLGASQGAADFAQISAGQSAVILALLSGATLQDGDKVDVAERIGRCSWATPEEKASLMEALRSSSSGRGSSSKKGLKYQDFRPMDCYLTARRWGRLLDQERNPELKLAELVDLMGSLGMRQASEPTFAKLTALYALCSEGVDQAKIMNKDSLDLLYQHVKKVFRDRVKGEPIEKIDELPLSPAEFRDKHPRTYAAVFVDEEPVPSPIRPLDLLAVCNHIALRDRKGKNKPGGTHTDVQMLQGMPADPRQMFQQMQQMMVFMGNCMSQMSGGRQPGVGCHIEMLGHGRPSPHSSLVGPMSSVSAAVGSPFGLPPFGFGGGAPGGPAPPPAVPAPTPALPGGPASSVAHEGPTPTPAVPHDGSKTTTSAAAEEVMPSGADTQSGATTVETTKLPKKSVDEACSVILGALRSKQKAASENCLKRPAAATPNAGLVKPTKCAKTETGAKAKAEKGCKLEKDAMPDKKGEKPTFSVERSRSQVLFRTGLRGAGQSTRLPFANDKEEAQAIKKAKSMVSAEKVRRGLE